MATTIHEICHAIESDNPAIYQSCLRFRNSRTVGETPQSLKKMTNLPYHPHEMAYRDRWEETGNNVYCGKIYDQEGFTEIFTMGVQRFYEDPVQFRQQDPEYFTLIVKLIRNLEV